MGIISEMTVEDEQRVHTTRERSTIDSMAIGQTLTYSSSYIETELRIFSTCCTGGGGVNFYVIGSIFID